MHVPKNLECSLQRMWKEVQVALKLQLSLLNEVMMEWSDGGVMERERMQMDGQMDLLMKKWIPTKVEIFIMNWLHVYLD